MDKRIKYTEEQRKEIIDYTKEHGIVAAHKKFKTGTDTIKKWMDPEFAERKKKESSQTYYEKYKPDPLYREKIQKKQHERYLRTHINSQYTQQQMRDILSLPKEESKIVYNIDDFEYNRIKQYIERTDDYTQKNKQKINEGTRKWRQKNAEKLSEQCKIKRQNLSEEEREKIRARTRNRKKTDPVFRVTESIRSRIWIALKGGKQDQHTEELLGCTFKYFKEYLENQFDANMSWENYGPYWHIDHIKPISSFDLSSIEEMKNAFHYTNCQPLEALENMKKSNKMLI